MKKILLFTVFVAIFNFGCAKKLPFKEEEPIKNTSLVYIYALKNVSSDENLNEDSTYVIKIDDKKINQRLAIDEYMKFDIKPGKVKFSALKDGIFERSVKFDAKPNKIYFIKLEQKNDMFSLSLQNKQEALPLISKTHLSNAIDVEEKDMVTKVLDTDEGQKSNESSFDKKLKKIKEAYEMKQQGIITEKEYQKIKRDILEEK
jgi:hypothetical protein